VHFSHSFANSPAKRGSKTGPWPQTPGPSPKCPQYYCKHPWQVAGTRGELLKIHFMAGISTLPTWAPPATNWVCRDAQLGPAQGPTYSELGGSFGARTLTGMAHLTLSNTHTHTHTRTSPHWHLIPPPQQHTHMYAPFWLPITPFLSFHRRVLCDQGEFYKECTLPCQGQRKLHEKQALPCQGTAYISNAVNCDVSSTHLHFLVKWNNSSASQKGTRKGVCDTD